MSRIQGDLEFSKNWESDEDFPTKEYNENTVRENIQLLFDETKDYINDIVTPAVNDNMERIENLGGGGFVSHNQIGDGAVWENNIKNQSVTEYKYGNSSIPTTALKDSSITADKFNTASTNEYVEGVIANKTDSQLSSSSTNAVQNKVVKNAIDSITPTQIGTQPHTRLRDMSATTGRFVKIKINNANPGWMLSFTVYLYSNYRSTVLRISGYNYATTGKWHLPRAEVMSSFWPADLTVRFGVDEANACWLAIPVDDYVGVDIGDVVNAYQPVTYENLFTITIENSNPTGTSYDDVRATQGRSEYLRDESTGSNITASYDLAEITSPTYVTVWNGRQLRKSSMDALLSTLPAWTADPSDNVYLIRQDTAGANVFGRVKFSTVYNYIKSKLTKSDIGLGNVENKSSATIRGELTKSNVTTALGYTPPTTNTTYSEATTSAAGLMSASDKTKLNGIASGANAYSLPAATSSTLGGVKVGSNISVSSGTISLTKANVTSALGYTPPTTDTNTTYSAATQSAAGLMSAADKKKLDGVATGANAYSLPTASSSTLGGVKTGSNITNSSGTISVSSSNVTNALGYTPMANLVRRNGVGYISGTSNGLEIGVDNNFDSSNTKDQAWIYLDAATSASQSKTAEIEMHGEVYPDRDVTWSLGYSGYRWDNIYGADIYGRIHDSSDARLKEDINYDLSDYVRLFDSLRPCTFKFKNDKRDEVHTGFIAQDLNSILDDAGIEKSAVVMKNPDDGMFYVTYTEFIGILIAKVQDLQRQVDELKAGDK